MEWLALSIFACTALYLVDKNHVWSGFWRFSKRVLIVAAVGLAGFIAFSKYEHRKVAANPPATLPANFDGWDK